MTYGMPSCWKPMWATRPWLEKLLPALGNGAFGMLAD